MTPEERREAYIQRTAAFLLTAGAPSELCRRLALSVIDGELNYKNNTEPAVADAIRYGLVVDDYDEPGMPALRITYPEGHPKA